MRADKNAPKIGIVIPIYNVAKYLRQCLDSVLNQTYGNFHAVLVNDGSTDNSKEIALEYIAKDSRFVLIDKENGGLSSARNAGISYFANSLVGNSSLDMQFRTCENLNTLDSSLQVSEANEAIHTNNLDCHENELFLQKDEEFAPKIDYIIFLDSDDFWEVNLLESCVESMQQYNAEIVWFSWKTFYDGLANPNGGGEHLAYYLWIHNCGHYQQYRLS